MKLHKLIAQEREILATMQTDIENLPFNIHEHLDFILKLNHQRGVIRGLEKSIKKEAGA